MSDRTVDALAAARQELAMLNSDRKRLIALLKDQILPFLQAPPFIPKAWQELIDSISATLAASRCAEDHLHPEEAGPRVVHGSFHHIPRPSLLHEFVLFLDRYKSLEQRVSCLETRLKELTK